MSTIVFENTNENDMSYIKVIWAALLLWISLAAASQTSSPELVTSTGIKFINAEGWSAIKNQAREEGKYIFLDCYTTWCGPCKMMDKEVYNDGSVGEFMNNRFLSIKVQIDTAKGDNKNVKTWYADARLLKEQYKIDVFPTLIFISPEGKLVYRDAGFMTVNNFLGIAKKAVDTKNQTYFAQLEDYKKGIKDYNDMDELATYAVSLGQSQLAKSLAEDYINSLTEQQLLAMKNILLVRNVIRDVPRATSLARKYKRLFLDSLSENAICTKANLDFIAQFSNLISTSDNLFYLCCREPEKVDKLEYKGWAASQVNRAITKDEMEEKLFKDGKAVHKNVNWGKLKAAISQKYKDIDAESIVLNYQISYYRKLQDWRKWVEFKDIRIKKYPPKNPVAISLELNDGGAWDAFLYCNDKRVLGKVLRWSELAIKLDGEKASYLDTKGNLLYKIGRISEAISVEEKAVEISSALAKDRGRSLYVKLAEGYSSVLGMMKRKEPTYIKEGAVWAANTMP